MMKPKNQNILLSLPGSAKRLFRKIVTSLVLSTDMARHSDKSKLLAGFRDDYLATGVIPTDDAHKYKMLGIVLHAADIGNTAKPWAAAQKWAKRCMEEFFRQGDMEEYLGYPVTPMMRRDEQSIPQCQIGFIQFVVLPYFKKIEVVFPEFSDCIIEME